MRTFLLQEWSEERGGIRYLRSGVWDAQSVVVRSMATKKEGSPGTISGRWGSSPWGPGDSVSPNGGADFDIFTSSNNTGENGSCVKTESFASKKDAPKQSKRRTAALSWSILSG